MAKRYIVHLSAEEREALQRLVRTGHAPARRIMRGRLLLLADNQQPDTMIATALGISVATVERTRKRCVEEGVDVALIDRHRPGAHLKLDGKQTAQLIALACSTPPDSREHWTMQLLADRLVALQVIESISDETVRRTLKKKRAEALAEGALVPE